MHSIVCTLQKEVANGFLSAFTWINIFIYLLNDFFLKIPFIILWPYIHSRLQARQGSTNNKMMLMV